MTVAVVQPAGSLQSSTHPLQSQASSSESSHNVGKTEAHAKTEVSDCFGKEQRDMPLVPDNDGTKSMELCLLDSKGNCVKVSSPEQYRIAVSLLQSNAINPEHRPNNSDRLPTATDQLQHDYEDEAAINFSTRGNTTPEAFLDEVKRFELFRSVIQHEDDLLNQRVSWIILAQSFLMAAFITNVSEDGSGDSLKYITAIVGLLTVVVTMPAILAAGRNIELQQKVYFAYISSEKRCRELHGHGRNILHNFGEKKNDISMKKEQQERLKYGHIFPNMAFRGRGGVPILFTVVALAIVQVVGWLFLLIALIKGW